MEFYEVLKKRRSIRGYKSTEISDDVFKRIGEAVYTAPSACNLQPWEIKIITNKTARENICKVYTADWLKQAPAIAVIIGDEEKAWKRLEGNSIIDVDIAIAMEHLVLAATAEGLGSCWICAYNIADMNKALGVTENKSALAITPLGYIAKEPRELIKKDIDDIFEIVK